jgi:hypothetical protein
MVRVLNPNPVLVDADRKAEWDVPPGSHGGHGGHNDSHGSEGKDAKPAGGAHSFHYDSRRNAGDKGYALSLNVLSGGMA